MLNLQKITSPLGKPIVRRSVAHTLLLLLILMAGSTTSFAWSPFRLAASVLSRDATSPQTTLSQLHPLDACIQPVLEAVPAESRVVVAINEVGLKRNVIETLSRYQRIPVSTQVNQRGTFFTLSLHPLSGAKSLTLCAGFELFLHTSDE